MADESSSSSSPAAEQAVPTKSVDEEAKADGADADADAAGTDAADAAAAGGASANANAGGSGDNSKENDGDKKGGGGGGGRRDRDRDETPIEDLYDLSQPIPHVARPSKEQHEAEIGEINAAIDALKEERTAVQTRVDACMSSGKNPEAEAEITALKALRGAKSSLINDKKALRSRLEALKKSNDRLQNERKSARSAVRYGSVAEINAEIAKLHKRQETTSMSLAEEKRLIKEIDVLEASKKTVAEIKSKNDALGDVKHERGAITDALDAKSAEIAAIDAEIDVRSKTLDALKEKESGSRDQIKKLFQQKDELRSQITAKIAERGALRETFREENNRWYNYQRAVRKQKQMKYDEERKVREIEREEWLKKKEEEELKKIPYEEEMALCDYLSDYLTRTYLTDAEAEKKKKEEELAKKRAADVVAVTDDPFANFQPVGKKKGDDEEVFLQMGKGKKKKRQRNKAKPPATLTLSVDSFEQFGLLGLTPPTSIEGVEKSVQDLQARKKWYSEQPRGSVKTAVEIRKENEKKAAKMKSSSASAGGADGADAAGGSAGKGGKKDFDATREDFAPLGSGPASSAVNSTWGQQKAPDQEVNDVVEE